MEWLTMGRLMMIIGDFWTIYMYGYMHRSLFERKEWLNNRNGLYALIYLLDTFVLIAANMFENPLINVVAFVSTYILPLYLCHKVVNLMGIINFTFFFIGTMALEAFAGVYMGYIGQSAVLKVDYNLMTPEISVLVYLCQLFLAFGIVKFGSKDKLNNQRLKRSAYMLMIMPLISVLILLVDLLRITLGMAKDINRAQLITMVLLIVVVNVVNFAVLEKYTRIVKREMKLVEDKHRIESDATIVGIAARSMKDRLTIAEQVMQQDQMMRHDRRHFEAMLLSLLEEGDLEAAKKCLRERMAVEPRGAKKYCDNTTVNAAISHYANWAIKEQITIDISTNIPSGLRVDDMELAITISNLLENAINACLKLNIQERYISLNTQYKEQLLIEIENSCEDGLELNEEGYPYTENREHGIGTRSVLAFANKTDSQIMYCVKDNRFRVRMIV